MWPQSVEEGMHSIAQRLSLRLLAEHLKYFSGFIVCFPTHIGGKGNSWLELAIPLQLDPLGSDNVLTG